MSGKRSEALLTMLESSGQITPDGRRWLVQVLDPFHDKRYDPVGYPDTEGGNSVVRQVNVPIVISAPSSITTGTWDLNIFTLPEATSAFPSFQQAEIGGGNNTWYLNQPNTGYNMNPSGGAYFGPICYVASATGNPTWNNSTNGTAGITVPAASGGVSIQSFLTGNTRIVGMGFEAVNTSPKIGIQGQVVCYAAPQSNSVENMWCYTSATVNGRQDICVSASPPATVGEAQSIPGSSTWDASEGAYVIGTMCEVSNPPKQLTLGGRHFRWRSLAGATGGQQNGTGVGYYPEVTYTSGIPTGGSDTYYQSTPYDTNGAYFTGLAPYGSTYPSQITLNCRILIEQFPYPSDTTMTLAHPSPCYDPKALEIYSAVVQRLKPYCMVKDNPKAEFWNVIMNLVKDIAPVVGIALSPFTGGASIPISAIVSGAAGATELALQNNRAAQAKKKTRKQAAQAADAEIADGVARKMKLQEPDYHEARRRNNFKVSYGLAPQIPPKPKRLQQNRLR